MIDVVVTQRVNAGMEAAFEALAREITVNTLS
jgi:antibiotic biosynthesis monooxygenase (ABM) superfamily enzyme